METTSNTPFYMRDIALFCACFGLTVDDLAEELGFEFAEFDGF